MSATTKGPQTMDERRCPATVDLWQGPRPVKARCILEPGHDGEHETRRDVHGIVEENGVRIEGEMVERIYWPQA